MEKYTACVLLGELPLSAKMINHIREDISQTTDICHRYLLAESSGEPADIANYIEAFPSGERQNLLWALHFDAGFPVSFVSPYFNLLAAQARHNDEALDQLISGIPYADTSSGEVLIDLLANIYRYFPEKIHTRLKANQIPENFIQLIIQTAASRPTKLRVTEETPNLHQ